MITKIKTYTAQACFNYCRVNFCDSDTKSCVYAKSYICSPPPRKLLRKVWKNCAKFMGRLHQSCSVQFSYIISPDLFL